MDTAVTQSTSKLKFVGREKAYWKEWRQNHKESVKATKAKTRAKNKAKYDAYDKEYKRKWYQRNKQRISQASKGTYPQRREAILARLRAKPISEEQRIRRKAYLRQWHLSNHPKVLVSRRKWTASGKEKICQDKWRKQNPGKIIASRHKRRALKKAATINLKSIERWIQSVRSKPTAVCYYCQKSIPSKKIHFDHIIPLSRGGAHSVENLCVSCQPCNNRKHAKSVQAFVITGQQILSL